MRTLSLLGIIGALTWANPSHASQCLGVEIETGKSYEFAVSELGTVTPMSVTDRGTKAVFVLHKSYAEPGEIGATGTFDTCQMAEAFVASAKAEVDAVMDTLGQVMGMPLNVFGDLGGLPKLGHLDDPPAEGGDAAKVDELLGQLTLRGSFYGKSCERLPDGGVDCVESRDPAEYERLQAEQRVRMMAGNAKIMCELQEQMGDNPSIPGYDERTAICQQKPTP